MASTTTTNHIDVSMLQRDDFISLGRVVSVSRPRTDWPFTTPATQWDVEYVENDSDDAPVLRHRFAAGTIVEFAR